MPTTENIRRIARDFAPGNEKYSAAHCFFTDRALPLYPPSRFIEGDLSGYIAISDQLLGELAGSVDAKRLQHVGDLYLNFWRM